MPSIQRPMSGDVLVFDLEEERERTADPALLERSGRNARTLLKNGALRATLVVLHAGGELSEHRAEGPITVQPLEGRIRFEVKGQTHELQPGQMLSLGGGVPHAVRSDDGATFLLTVSQQPRTETSGARD